MSLTCTCVPYMYMSLTCVPRWGATPTRYRLAAPPPAQRSSSGKETGADSRGLSTHVSTLTPNRSSDAVIDHLPNLLAPLLARVQ
jgi:hypothetical protein